MLVTLLVVVVVIVLLFVGVLIAAKIVTSQPQFGAKPEGDRLKRMEQSPNFKNGVFENLEHTPALAEGASYPKVMKKFFFGKSKNGKPTHVLPSKKHDLLKLNLKDDLIVWFGHSSYYLQLAGKRFLVDPVFSGNASPFSFTTKSFKGADVYTPADFPEIDFLVLTHDHYDHLDYKTIKGIKPKINHVVTSLGVGGHLEHWGFDKNIITELDWNEKVDFEHGFSFTATPSRHFSGRGFKRNNTLWMSVVLVTPTLKVFLGGDSGYGKHFSEIGNKFGPFDLVILENGQYNEYWKYIHMMPEQTVQAAIDLGAKTLFPVHWSKFELSIHDWDEPINRVVAESKLKNLPLMHPMIGEVVYLGDTKEPLEWWRNLV